MLIIHALSQSSWANCTSHYGENYVQSEGFIHCSDVHTFHKVAPNFADVQEEMLLLFIETDLVKSPIKWEDLDGCGTPKLKLTSKAKKSKLSFTTMKFPP